MLKASQFEFRNRFWFIGCIYGAGFAMYKIDHVNVVQYALDHTIGGNSSHADLFVHSAFGIAALLALAAALIRTWGTAYLRADVMQDPNVRADSVVADGPYRHVRNPLYVGGILLGLAFGFLASRIGAVVIIVGLTIFYLRLIALEEPNLEREQGERYREFSRRVPRIVPSLTPRIPSSGLKPQWGQAILGETFMWGFFVGVAAFAVTLKIAVTWAIMGFALVVYIVRSYMLYGRRKAAKVPGGQA